MAAALSFPSPLQGPGRAKLALEVGEQERAGVGFSRSIGPFGNFGPHPTIATRVADAKHRRTYSLKDGDRRSPMHPPRAYAGEGKERCAKNRISPTRSTLSLLSSPAHKNISLKPSGKSHLRLRASRLDKRGVGHRHERWAGCGGRFGDARRAAQKRTAKSCGPDAPMLALTRR